MKQISPRLFAFGASLLLPLLPFLAVSAHAGKRSACQEASDAKYQDAQGARQGKIPCLTPDGKKMRETSWEHGDQTGPETTFDAEGKPLKEIGWKANHLDGASRTYGARSHKLVAETNYRDGKRDGREREWFDEPHYALKFERNYAADRLNGPSLEFSAPNVMRSKGAYRDGQPDGEWKRFDPQGKLTSLETFAGGRREGIAKRFDPDHGTELGTECWKAGTRQESLADCGGSAAAGGGGPVSAGGRSTEVEKFPGGQVHKQWEVRAGKKDGIAKTFFENGTLAEQFTYVEGHKEGPAKTFYASGKLEDEVSYRHDVFDGALVTHFEETGTPKSSVTWKDGKRHGAVTEFYMNGKASRESRFERGRERHRLDYFDSGQKHLEQGWDDQDRQAGPSREWRKDGTLVDEASYVAGRLDGVRKRLDPATGAQIREEYAQGALKRRETTLPGAPTPQVEEFYPDGSKKSGP